MEHIENNFANKQDDLDLAGDEAYVGTNCPTAYSFKEEPTIDKKPWRSSSASTWSSLLS